MNCAEVRSLLSFRPIDVLEDEDQGPLDEHLESCVACRDEARAVEEAFSALQAPEPDERLPESLWTSVVKGIEAPSEPAPASRAVPDVTIAVSCAYCHDTLTRAEASYCASCLAPHHEDCWRQHGRCSAFGCEETHVVRPHADTTPPRKRSNRARNGVILLLVAGTGSLAAVAARQAHREKLGRAALDEQLALEQRRAAEEATRREVAQEALRDSRKEQQERIDDLTAMKNRVEDEKIEAGRKFENERRQHQDDLDAHEKEIERLRREYERRLNKERRSAALDPPRVTLHARDEDLREVLAAITSQTGKTFRLAVDVHEKVTFDLNEIPWACAVALLARDARCSVYEQVGGIFLVEQPPRVTIQFVDANLRTMLQLIGAYAGKNVIVDDSVTGNLTLDIHDIAWTDALETIARAARCRIGRRGEIVSVSARPDADLGSPDIAGDGLRVWSFAQVLGEIGDADAPPARKVTENALRCVRCDARAWLALLARCCGKSLVASETIRGELSLDLLAVTYEEALEKSVKKLGDYVVVPDGSDCLRIEPRGEGPVPVFAARPGRTLDKFGQDKVAVKLEGATPERMKVTAIVTEPGFSCAVIETDTGACIVKEGDIVEGVHVAAMTRTGVTLMKNPTDFATLELPKPR